VYKQVENGTDLMRIQIKSENLEGGENSEAYVQMGCLEEM
jgi:hypothetical protein